MNSIHNGRVNIKSQDTNKLFGMFDKWIQRDKLVLNLKNKILNNEKAF